MDATKQCRLALPRVDCHRFLLFGADIPAKKIQGKQTGNFRLPDADIRRAVQLPDFRGGTEFWVVGRNWISRDWDLSCEQTELRTTLMVIFGLLQFFNLNSNKNKPIITII